MINIKTNAGNTPSWMVGLLMVVVILTGTRSTSAAERVDPYAGMDREQRRVFQAYTRLFCRQFFRFGEDRFVLLPNHYRERENSNGRTFSQAEEEMTEIRVIRRGNFKYEERIEPHPGEVTATALALPAIDVGHYGIIQAVTVEEVVGPEEMIVRGVTLVFQGDVGSEPNTLRQQLLSLQRQYEYKTYRLLGFDTEGLHKGRTFRGARDEGIHVAVMSTDPEHNFVMVNYDKLERVRTTEFHEALAYVHLTPLAFNDMVRDNRERLRTDGDKASLIAIYRRYYNRYRPARLVPAPAIQPEPAQPANTEAEDQQGEPEPNQTDQPDTPATTPPPDKRPDPEVIDAPPPDDDEEEDDWEYDEDEDDTPDEPDFFGIPF